MVVSCHRLPVVSIELTEAEREQLESWSRRLTTAQALAQRSKIVLLVADGLRTGEIAGASGCIATRSRSGGAVLRPSGWTGWSMSRGRGSRGRSPTPMVDEVITRTLESAPKNATHWSTRSMAAEVGLTQSAVHRIWKAFGLQPHRTETFKLCRDPQFVAKVRDVVGLYLNPPERAVVLCVDEKSQIQALDRTQPILPMRPGLPERATHDYKRHGTSSLYAALDLSSGKVIGSLHSRHRAIEFKQFLQTHRREVPADLDVHVILDNSSTHKTPAIQQMAHRAPALRAALHPDPSSWLNLVERWFAELTNKKLRRGAHRSVGELNADIRAWIQTWNDDPKPFVWTKTADQILESITRYCTRINESGH